MDKPCSQKWIISFVSIVLAIVLLLSSVAYIIDPFLQFRVKDNSYILRGWFVSNGLIENYDYDTLIIGSSMAQCFDMDVFREELGVKPLHIGISRVRPSEISQLVNVAYQANKAKTFYICLDLATLGKKNEDTESRYPEYLLKKDVLSKLRYLLSYEVWFRFIPLDSCLMLLDLVGVTIPEKLAYNRSIDRLEDWRLAFPPSVTGKDVVIKNYKNNKYNVSTVNTENLYEESTANLDEYLSTFNFEAGKHIFFFPPYSSLYWCTAQDGDYFDTYLQIKRYFFEKATAYGAEVYDFQCADLTGDLDNYKDITRYLPKINDWMVKCFAHGDYLVTTKNFDAFQNKLAENTNSFRSDHSDLFR